MSLVAGLFNAYPLIAGLFDAYPKASSTKMIAGLFNAYSLLEIGTYKPSSVVLYLYWFIAILMDGIRYLLFTIHCKRVSYPMGSYGF